MAKDATLELFYLRQDRDGAWWCHRVAARETAKSYWLGSLHRSVPQRQRLAKDQGHIDNPRTHLHVFYTSVALAWTACELARAWQEAYDQTHPARNASQAQLLHYWSRYHELAAEAALGALADLGRGVLPVERPYLPLPASAWEEV